MVFLSAAGHRPLTASEPTGLPLAALATILIACSNVEAPRAAEALRDSAGIAIIDNRDSAWTDETRWRLGDHPVLDIGQDDRVQFANVLGVHRLGNGVTAVLDAWIPVLMFFDSRGNMIGRVGREGNGPGEFASRSIRHSFTCGGDTVFVVMPRRIAAYVPPGEYVRTVSLSQPAIPRACGASRIVAEATYGEWRSSAGEHTDSTLLVAFRTDGSFATIIDTVPRQVSDWVRGPEGLGYARAPFSPVLSVAARDSQVVFGFGRNFEVEFRDAAGALRRLLRLHEEEERVSREHVDQFLSYVSGASRGSDDEHRRLERRMSAAVGRPLPRFGELLLDQQGNLWARRYDHSDAVAFYDYSRMVRGVNRPTVNEARRWAVFDRDGRFLGTIAVPPNFAVHAVTAAGVVGVWRDSMDVPFVREYPLLKPRG